LGDGGGGGASPGPTECPGLITGTEMVRRTIIVDTLQALLPQQQLKLLARGEVSSSDTVGSGAAGAAGTRPAGRNGFATSGAVLLFEANGVARLADALIEDGGCWLDGVRYRNLSTLGTLRTLGVELPAATRLDQGAEKLAAVLQQLLGPIVAAVQDSGGDVISIEGERILAVFAEPTEGGDAGGGAVARSGGAGDRRVRWAETATQRALRCAAAVSHDWEQQAAARSVLAGPGTRRGSQERLLQLRAALSAGSIRQHLLGGRWRRRCLHYVLGGVPVQEVQQLLMPESGGRTGGSLASRHSSSSSSSSRLSSSARLPARVVVGPSAWEEVAPICPEVGAASGHTVYDAGMAAPAHALVPGSLLPPPPHRGAEVRLYMCAMSMDSEGGRVLRNYGCG
jgi:hypothetical protein